MFQFSDRTLEMLYKAGWSEDYRYDVSHYRNFLSSQGYDVHDAALSFMQRFGGLVIAYPLPKKPEATEILRLAVTRAPDSLFKDKARNISEEIGVGVIEIGTFETGDLDLYMDATGCVYGEGAILVRVAKSGEEAIENICSGNYGENLLTGSSGQVLL
ncbi:MAG: hypothetical protein JWL77_5870 [Chthonomonadaceae bacterium]|nr:hypothetical protein [Chthonomonadaceae bacterium]